jgi:hypothetical protein
MLQYLVAALAKEYDDYLEPRLVLQQHNTAQP